MKAVVCDRYGGPEVMRVVEIPTPQPKANDVQIRVERVAVTPTDVAGRLGKPWMIRLMMGLTKPKTRPGTDYAGEISAVGGDVTEWRVGQRVFGATNAGFGTYAEFVTMAADAILTTIPDGIDIDDTCGVCDGAMTALAFLRDHAKLQLGQSVLINGASGSVGSYGVQLAKEMGARVTAVCGTRNLALMRQLGADAVVDYTKEDFTQVSAEYDVIFDAIGKSSFGACKQALKPGGIYMTTVPSLGIVGRMLWTRFVGNKKALFAATGLSQTRASLEYLRTLLADGRFHTVIDRHYPLADVAEAHRYVESGRKTGSVILDIASPQSTASVSDKTEAATPA